MGGYAVKSVIGGGDQPAFQWAEIQGCIYRQKGGIGREAALVTDWQVTDGT